MDNKLPAFIQSHEQLGLYIMQIDGYRSFLLQHDAGSPASEPEISAELKKYLQDSSESSEITQTILEEKHELFKELKQKAPRFNITFASLPRDSMKRDITTWFRANIHKHALIAFHYDRTIAGGMIVRGRNNILDFSFAPKLEEPKKQLTEIINTRTDK